MMATEQYRKKNIRNEGDHSWGALDGTYLGTARRIDKIWYLTLGPRGKARPMTPGFETEKELLEWVDKHWADVKARVLIVFRNPG